MGYPLEKLVVTQTASQSRKKYSGQCTILLRPTTKNYEKLHKKQRIIRTKTHQKLHTKVRKENNAKTNTKLLHIIRTKNTEE